MAAAASAGLWALGRGPPSPAGPVWNRAPPGGPEGQLQGIMTHPRP